LDAFTRIVTDLEMPAHAIVNVGADYQWKKFTLGFNVRNLFNTNYYRSGMNTKLVPQKGLWFMFDVAYKF
jgi:iron complex outermembrane receptor protein